MNLTGIRVIIRENVNDVLADVDQCVVDAVNFLSNFWHLDKIDVSETTVLNQSWINYAVDFLKLRKLKIGDVYIDQLLTDENLQDIEDEDLQLWYIAGGKIQLTSPMTSTGDAITILYESEFLQPALAIDTDVPNRLLELVYRGATYRYFDKLATKVATMRQNYPDVTPEEIATMRKQWKESFDLLLKEAK